MFEDIINLLERSATASSAELIAACEQNKLALAKINDQVDELERERQDLLLKSADKEIDAIDRKIAALHRQSDRHHAVDAKLSPLIEAAVIRERSEEIELRAKRAQKQQADLLYDLVELDSLANRLGQVLARFAAGQTEIDQSNAFVKANGRPDLVVVRPDWALARHLGLESPTSLPRFYEWELDGYWPPSNNTNRPRLGKAKELIG